jgi:carbon monoxide dehydrogenase subunit G
MKFQTKEDIDKPIANVFARLSDFENFERIALQRGVTISRKFKTKLPETGDSWDCKFRFRRKNRNASIVLLTFSTPDALYFKGDSQAIDVTFKIDLMALSKTRTRIMVDAVMSPKTLAARLFVQSMKLTRSKFNKRFAMRVAEFAKDIERGA